MHYRWMYRGGQAAWGLALLLTVSGARADVAPGGVTSCRAADKDKPCADESTTCREKTRTVGASHREVKYYQCEFDWERHRALVQEEKKPRFSCTAAGGAGGVSGSGLLAMLALPLLLRRRRRGRVAWHKRAPGDGT